MNGILRRRGDGDAPIERDQQSKDYDHGEAELEEGKRLARPDPRNSGQGRV